MHIHAFSPLEVSQGAATLGITLEAFLRRLKAAGLGTLPGTAAEILDDEIRAVICPDKINTEQWLEVVRTAHRVGLRTTSTIMYGHVETSLNWARHLLRLRDLQAETGGLTEFVRVAVRAYGGADVSAGPGAEGADVSGGDIDACGGAVGAASADAEYPGELGETGAGGGDGGAGVGGERHGWDVDEREYFARGGDAAWAGDAAGGDGGVDPAGGSGAVAADERCYEAAGQERVSASFGAAELAPIVLTKPRRRAAAE
jgi:FO synthase